MVMSLSSLLVHWSNVSGVLTQEANVTDSAGNNTLALPVGGVDLLGGHMIWQVRTSSTNTDWTFLVQLVDQWIGGLVFDSSSSGGHHRSLERVSVSGHRGWKHPGVGVLQDQQSSADGQQLLPPEPGLR